LWQATGSRTAFVRARRGLRTRCVRSPAISGQEDADGLVGVAFEFLGCELDVAAVEHRFVQAGGASPEWMVNAGRQIADALPKGRLHVLDGQEHVVLPEVLVPVLMEFMRLS
jgi:hypothetical protein